MNSLKNLAAISEALGKVAEKRVISHDNGTHGQSIECYYWTFEALKTKERHALELERTKAFLSNKLDEMSDVDKKLLELPEEEITMVFRLVNTIPVLRGTNDITEKGKSAQTPVAKDVQFIYIRKNVVEGDFIPFEETGKKAQDMSGNETPVISLMLSKCIVDVSKAEANFVNNEWKEWKKAKAYVTPVSFKSMSILSSVNRSIQFASKRYYGTEAL